MKTRVAFTMIGVALALAGIFVLLTPAISHADVLVPPASGKYKIGDFLILVDEQLVVKGAAKVTCCLGPTNARSDLGSRGSVALGGSMTTAVPSGAPLIKDVAVIAPTITLRNFAQVSQTIAVTAASLIKSGSSIVGPTEATVDPRLPADLPDFPVFAPDTGIITVGASDVVVPANDSWDLAPGSYRDLIIGANATVNFTAPGHALYEFRRIIANTASHYRLVIGGVGAQINVKEFVRFAEYGEINRDGKPGLTFYVEGADDSYLGANKNKNGVIRLPAGAFPAAFEYDGDGTFNVCLVFVKNGTANVRGSLTYATQWFGNSFQQISNLHVTLQSPGDICFQAQPPCDCCDRCE